MIIRIHHECAGGIENFVRSLMPNGNLEGPIFLSHTHKINGFFFLLTLNALFYIGNKKHVKDFKKNPNTLSCDIHVTL